MIEFQSGHPVRGATRPQRPRKALCPNFNPRAPCGARRDRRCGDHARADISIHAPRVGRDVQILGRVVELRAFQSTRPVWGATDIKCARLMVLPISIHAPRVGRDHAPPACRSPLRYFNPRAPCGARLKEPFTVSSRGIISIHAPRVGRDDVRAGFWRGGGKFQSTRPVWGATYTASDDR